MSDRRYAFGHSADELERLEWQGRFLRPYTRRLLAEAGVGPGMRVLDIGCGTGDVARLAAELVGPAGSVVGIDKSAEAIASAEELTTFANVRFETGSLADFPGAASCDAVLGRYVLVHQADPVAFLRSAARHVRPGGVLALHEIDPALGIWSCPEVPLWGTMFRWVAAAVAASGAPAHTASRLFEHFDDAALPPPRVSCEKLVGGGPDSPLYRWMGDIVRSLLPALAATGVDVEAIDVGTLPDRLREETVRSRSQLEGPGQYLAWVRL